MVRDERGRFPKGVSGNPTGRKKRQVEDDFLRLLQGAVTKDDWITICVKAINQARAGDSVARKWLADYLIGPPVERKELTGANGEALRIEIIDIDSTVNQD